MEAQRLCQVPEMEFINAHGIPFLLRQTHGQVPMPHTQMSDSQMQGHCSASGDLCA